GRENAQGRVRSLRSARAARGDAADGRHDGAHGHAAGHCEDEESARRREPRRTRAQAPGGDHRFDDAAGAEKSRSAQGEPQETHRRGLRHKSRGRQPYAQNAPRHGRPDEGDGIGQARTDGGACQHAGARRRHAERGRHAEACAKHAGRTAGIAERRAGCTRASTQHPRPAAAIAGGPAPSRPRRQAARPRRISRLGEEEEMKSDRDTIVGGAKRSAAHQSGRARETVGYGASRLPYRRCRATRGEGAHRVCRRCMDETQSERNQMSLKIRLARAGTKKRPVYHIVIADSRFPRDGRFIERLGYFNPLLPKDKTERLKLDLDKVKAWLAKGARPTDRVLRFLDQAGIMQREKRNKPATNHRGKPNTRARAPPQKEQKAQAEDPPKPAAAPTPAPPAGAAPAGAAPTSAAPTDAAPAGGAPAS